MMNTCPRCGLELLGYNEDCPQCGYALKQRQASLDCNPPVELVDPVVSDLRPRAMHTTITPPARAHSMADLLNLRWMLGPAIIRLIYWIGLVIGSVLAIGLPFQEIDGPARLILLEFAKIDPRLGPPDMRSLFANLGQAVFNLIFFNVLWRLMCEGWILLYDIRNQLVALVRNAARE